MFPIRNGLKHRDALSPLLFNFALGFQINQDGLNLSGTQLVVYADDILGGSLHTTKRNA
jgi:hypothetical protein